LKPAQSPIIPMELFTNYSLFAYDLLAYDLPLIQHAYIYTNCKITLNYENFNQQSKKSNKISYRE